MRAISRAVQPGLTVVLAHARIDPSFEEELDDFSFAVDTSV